MLIDNPVVEAKVPTLAPLTGETVQAAIAAAADERMARFSPKVTGRNDPSIEEILATVRSFGLRRINEDLSEEEILGYGPNGSCA